MKEIKESLYLPNLNGIRFVAAFMVLIHHLEYTKKELGLNNIWTQNGLGYLGDLGVTLFFTLSGFLITYLLLMEKHKTGVINIKSFYIRRILRIWPLYYFIIFIALFFLPKIDFFELPTTITVQENIILKTTFFVLMLPNVIFSFFPRVPYAVQSWSIGVEEQFYLIWPWIINSSKRIFTTLGLIFITFFVINEVAIFYKYLHEKSGQLNKGGFLEQIGHLVIHFKIGCMAAGGFAAALYVFHKDFALKLMNLKIQFFLIVSVILICIFSNDFFKSHEILSLLFSVLILNFAFSEKVLFNLEIELIKYLGKISYGLYMYQFIAITIVLKSNVFISMNSVAANIYYYFASLSLTIIISIISYEFFEKRFIRFKEKFQMVKSIT